MKKKTRSKAEKKMRNYRKKSGLPPGSLVYTGSAEGETKLRLISFDKDSVTQSEKGNIREMAGQIAPGRNNWLSVTGLNDTEQIRLIGEQFGIHPLLLEDALNTDSFPKIEDTSDTLFISLKMLSWKNENRSIASEQISFILGKDFILSFEERPNELFERERQRLLNGPEKTREKGPDFLAYILIDQIIDNYFLVLGEIEDRIEETEMDLLNDSDEVTPLQMMHLKKQLIMFRKFIYPLRDAVRKLQRDDSALIDRKTLRYVNDLYDHLQNIIQNLESFRDITTGLMDLYSNSLSNRLNSIMKTLTVIGAIFIPLTFIAGIYGMNFANMPELNHPLAYPAVLVFMLLIAIAMIIWMKRKKWF